MKHFAVLTAACLLLAGCNAGSPVPPADTPPSSSSSAAAQTVSWTPSDVSIDGLQVLTIDRFPDEIQVSADASFGSSDRITGAMLSPDGQWIAVSVAGAAHGFGWLYNMSSDDLRPVAFQYGGAVDIKHWSDDSRSVVLSITSPEPSTTDVAIDLAHLPEYPRVPVR